MESPEVNHRRIIYAEEPYAAVLKNRFLKSHCSNCFLASCVYPCPKGCRSIYYCTEKCSLADAPWHEIECSAYKRSNKEDRPRRAETPIRMIGRLATRLQKDGGVKQKTESGSDDYPCFPDYVKERTYADLTSHYDDFVKRPSSKEETKHTVAGFCDFYESTSLSSLSDKSIMEIFYTCRINGLAIPADDTLGMGLYLNSCRFNHSCQPKVSFSVRGCRIVVAATEHVHPDEYSTEIRFNQLTCDYGISTSDYHGCYIVSTRQRIDSLKRSSFFRCLCETCADTIAILVEERAAKIECRICSKPYVWMRSGRLKSICQCESTPTEKIDRKSRRQLLSLDKYWKRVMTATDHYYDSRKNVDICESFWLVAKRWWHPVHNVRLKQLTEKLASYLARNSLNYEKVDKKVLMQSRAHCLNVVASFYEQTSDKHYEHLASIYKERAERFLKIADTIGREEDSETN